MNPHFSPRSAPVRGGFTLIELLVVIAIIAVLVTGAFGAYLFVMDRVRLAEAQSTARTVTAAVENFEKDYDRLPEPTSATARTDSDSDTSAAEGLLPILLGQDKTQNPRAINFLGDLKDATVRSNNLKVDGLVRDGETVELVDPWGTTYKVRLDLDSNGKVANPDSNEFDNGKEEIYRRVIVWSAGKDKDFSTWKDNPASWKDN
jgi:prepilin-type N-terminal cleavage/methylation domain-containing protein